LGDSIFGFNEQKLDQIVLELLALSNSKIFVLEDGFDEPFQNLFPANLVVINNELKGKEKVEKLLEINAENLYKHINPNILLILNLTVKEFEKSTLSIKFRYKDQDLSPSFTFGGHHKFAYTWARNTTLNFLRLQLSK
jgi:hypothetical protein